MHGVEGRVDVRRIVRGGCDWSGGAISGGENVLIVQNATSAYKTPVAVLPMCASLPFSTMIVACILLVDSGPTAQG